MKEQMRPQKQHGLLPTDLLPRGCSVGPAAGERWLRCRLPGSGPAFHFPFSLYYRDCKLMIHTPVRILEASGGSGRAALLPLKQSVNESTSTKSQDEDSDTRISSQGP